MRTSCPAFCSPSGKRTLVGGDSSRLKGARAKGRPPEVAAARGRLRRCRSSTMRRHRLRRVALHPTPRRSQRRLTPFFSSLLEFRVLTIAPLALWLTYAAAVAGSIWLSRRFVGEVGRRAALLLAALPLVFVGKAMFLGRLYGPAGLFHA